MTSYTTITDKFQQTVQAPTPRFLIYQPYVDYYLGPRHTGWKLPIDVFPVAEVSSSDFFLLPEDLRRLQIDLGSTAIAQFAASLPFYRQFPERHIFLSSHDDPRSPLPDSIFCKTSISQLESNNLIALPYPVDDFTAQCHFDLAQIRWHTCFVGYPGSSPLREQLLIVVASSRQLSSQLDIAPKFHSHLDLASRVIRRQHYLDTLAASLTVLCPRGDGMNSIRFYETLSMGRIPVLVSDNCVLPFEKLIPYDRFVIRIGEKDICNADTIIAEWIRGINCDELICRCREARQAWEELLAPKRISAPLQQVLVTNYGTRKGSIASVERLRQQGMDAYRSENTNLSEELFRQALTSCPEDHETIRCLALLLNEAGKFEECITLLVSTRQKNITVPTLHRLLGEAYQQTENWEQAFQEFQLALEEESENAILLMNMGIVCSKRDQHEEALEHLQHATVLVSDSAQILMNLACVQQALNQIDAAIRTLREAVRLEPGYGTATWNLSQALLLKGSFTEGFKLFESRFIKQDPVPRFHVPFPFWQGEPLSGKTIIITTEQAFGDAIQFVRYLPMLAQQGARVILYNHLPPLQQLFASVPGVTAVITSLSELPMADYQIPMLSLPRLFSTTSVNIPNRLIPYLAPSSQKQAFWRTKLTAAVGIKIGICWAGRQKPDPHRSATLFDFAPLRQLSSAVFYSLQLGEGSEQAATPPQGIRLIDFTGDIHNFEDTAALIGQLDLIISVDTSVAHLAGALGKPTFTLLPFAPDWRWMLHRQDSPWYPTMRLFRQKKTADWKDPIQEILAFLTTI